MITCTDYRRWLSAYVDGALEPDQRVQLEGHVLACAPCAKELDAVKRMLASLRTMAQVEAPADLLQGVRARLDAARQPARVFQWPLPSLPLRGLALAATAVLVVIVIGLPTSLQWREVQRPGFELAQKQNATMALSREGALRSLEAPAIGRVDDLTADRKQAMFKEKAEQERRSEGKSFRGSEALSNNAILERAASLPAAQSPMSSSEELPDDQAALFGESDISSMTSSAKADADIVMPIRVQIPTDDLETERRQVVDWIRASRGEALVQSDHELLVWLPLNLLPAFYTQLGMDEQLLPMPHAGDWVQVVVEFSTAP